MKHRTFILYTLLTTLLFSLPLRGRAGVGLPLERAGVGSLVSFYSNSDGRALWHTTKVLQDKKGFMWFSTWNGLNRFDGMEFVSFKIQPGDGNDVPSDRIRDFYLENEGTFLCQIDEQIFRFDPVSCKFSAVSPTPRIEALFKKKPQAGTSQKPHELTIGGQTLRGVHHPFTDYQGNTWYVATDGVYCSTPIVRPFQYVDAVNRDIIRCMYRDKKGRIWICTKSDDTGEVVVFDSSMRLLGYLGTDGTLHKTHTQFHAVYTILHDRDGQLWLGTKPDGLFRLTENANGTFTIRQFISDDSKYSLNSNQIYDIKQDSHGKIWIGTQHGGLNCIERPLDAAPRFLNNKNVMKAFPQQCLRMRRLLILDEGQGIIMSTTTEGILVVGGTHGDVSKMTYTCHAREPKRANSLNCSATMDILRDTEGHIYVSTESGGVNMLMTTDLTAKQFEFKHITQQDGLGSDVVSSLTEIRGGLLLLCPTQLIKLNTQSYASLSYGMSFWNDTFRFSDPRPLRLTNGNWLMPLEQGAIIFNEESLHMKKSKARLCLTKITIDGDTTIMSPDYLDTLRLAPNQRDITIGYAMLDYRDPGVILYQSRLSDEEEWTSPSASRQTTLYNLQPGTYKMQIRSTNAEGMWQDEVRELTIIVEPTFFESALGKLLILLLVIGIVGGITYTISYIHNLHKKQQATLAAYLALLNSKSEDTATDNSDGMEEPSDKQEEQAAQPETDTQEMVMAASDPFTIRLLRFVEENISNSDIGVDEMASATAMSRSSLNRKMKTMMGVTPADFLKEARLKRAANILLSSDGSIADVAYSCGFSDAKYFAKCFKAKYGCTPREYK